MEAGGYTLVIYTRLHGITFQNTINLHRHCCEILKSSKTVPTFLEMSRRAMLRNGLYVYMSTWRWSGRTLLLDRLNRRTERTKQYYKRCPCRYVSDRQTDARNELNAKLTRTAHNKHLCAGLVMPQGPRANSQCKLMQKQL